MKRHVLSTLTDVTTGHWLIISTGRPDRYKKVVVTKAIVCWESGLWLLFVNWLGNKEMIYIPLKTTVC